jgi:hypothetical protein
MWKASPILSWGCYNFKPFKKKHLLNFFKPFFLGSIKPLVWDEVSCKPTFQVSRAIFDQNQVLFWSGMLRTHQRPPGLAATSLDRY